MPFDLSHDASLLAPAPGLIVEAGIEAPHMVGRTANGSRNIELRRNRKAVGSTPAVRDKTGLQEGYWQEEA